MGIAWWSSERTEPLDLVHAKGTCDGRPHQPRGRTPLAATQSPRLPTRRRHRNRECPARAAHDPAGRDRHLAVAPTDPAHPGDYRPGSAARTSPEPTSPLQMATSGCQRCLDLGVGLRGRRADADEVAGGPCRGSHCGARRGLQRHVGRSSLRRRDRFRDAGRISGGGRAAGRSRRRRPPMSTTGTTTRRSSPAPSRTRPRRRSSIHSRGRPRTRPPNSGSGAVTTSSGTPA